VRVPNVIAMSDVNREALSHALFKQWDGHLPPT